MEYEPFVVYVAVLNIDSDDEVQPLKRITIAYLKADEAPTKVFNKYTDFTNIFLLKLAIEFPEHMGINNYAIKLIDNQ